MLIFSVVFADTEWICHVCEKACSNAHICLKCNKPVHAICGEHPANVDEGYGAPVVCSKCVESKFMLIDSHYEISNIRNSC